MHDDQVELHQLPCLYCQPHDYIRMVQHMIESCLLLHMSRDECVEALAKHARIQPIITLTVWKELLKENKGFFRAYLKAISPTHIIDTYQSAWSKKGESDHSEEDS